MSTTGFFERCRATTNKRVRHPHLVKKLPCRVCGKTIELSEVAAKYAAGSAVHAMCVPKAKTTRKGPSFKNLTRWLDRVLSASD